MSKFLQTTHRDIAWFKQAHDLGQLQMRPPFQRNPVWTDRQKGFLMDTILNSYPIPELYMQDIVNENGEKQYVVVDGQQRITACLEFISGDFSIDSRDSISFGNVAFDDLSPAYKKQIYSYQFVIRILPEASDIELREIFQRLNRNNVALNQQELRQATYWGPFIETMNELAELELWSNLNVFTSNDIKRMLDVEFISELSIALLHGVQNKKLTLDKYYKAYEEDFPQKMQIKETFDFVLREIVNVLPNIKQTRWSKKTDFYTLFLLKSKYKYMFPLDNQNRKKLSDALIIFGNQVDKFVSVKKDDWENTSIVENEEGEISPAVENEEEVNVSENVKQYGLNLRASSDLGARRKREEALERELSPIFNSIIINSRL